MAVTLPDARQLSDETLEALRIRAIKGCELGFSQSDVAELLGVERETVCRWCSAYASGGLEALPKQRSGRPQGSGMLSAEQGQRIQTLLDTKQPEELSIAASLWSRRAVRDLIQKELGIHLAVRTVGDYLKRWGYTAKRPSRRSRDQDPEAIRQWEQIDYPALEKRAEEEGAEVFWADETGCRADEHPGYGYAKKGEPAIINVPNSHIGCNMISAISNDGNVRFMTYTSMMNGALFIVFLTRLLRSVTHKVFLIVDHLRAHEWAEVNDWLAKHKDRIEVFYLPTYAPESNPDEYLNNDLKGQVNAQGLPENKHQLRSRIQSFMRRLLHLPEHVRNFFKHPKAAYAGG